MGFCIVVFYFAAVLYHWWDIFNYLLSLLTNKSQGVPGGFAFGRVRTSTPVSNKHLRNHSRSKGFPLTHATLLSPYPLPLRSQQIHQKISSSTSAFTLPSPSPFHSLGLSATGIYSLVPFVLLVASLKG